MSMVTNKRIAYFDLLKLFAVLLVIVGHVISQYDDRGYGHPINVWIYSFHMPLFMFMSGLFFQTEYLQPIITQYFIDNKSEIWLLFLIAHSKR